MAVGRGGVVITPLELRWRREFDAQREERVAMSVELGRARLNLDALDAWNNGEGRRVVDAPKPEGALL